MLEIERALLADIIHKHTTKNNKNLFKELESHKEKGSQKGKGKGREREEILLRLYKQLTWRDSDTNSTCLTIGKAVIMPHKILMR